MLLNSKLRVVCASPIVRRNTRINLLLIDLSAPVTKVEGKSLWPIQSTLVEIPAPVRDHMSAVLIFSAWLGGTHSNRDLLWTSIVDQIQNRFKSGIITTRDSGEFIQVSVRAQFVTFNLPALAQTCNVIHFNGYDACPDCMALP